jgi:hypothetical protein
MSGTFLDQVKDALKYGRYDDVGDLLRKSIELDKDEKDKGYACWMLSKAYTHGLWGIECDTVTRREILTKGINFGDAMSMMEVVRLEYTWFGRLVQKETDELRTLIKQITQSKNSFAKARLCMAQSKHLKGKLFYKKITRTRVFLLKRTVSFKKIR